MSPNLGQRLPMAGASPPSAGYITQITGKNKISLIFMPQSWKVCQWESVVIEWVNYFCRYNPEYF
jgi:hypothetical protein